MIQRLPDAEPRAAALLRDTASFFGRTDSLAARVVSDSALASGTFRIACSPRVDVAVIEGFRFAPLWPPNMKYELVREIAGLARSHLAMDDACVVCELDTGPGAMGELIAATRSRPPRYFLVPTVPSPTAYSFAVTSDREATSTPLMTMRNAPMCSNRTRRAVRKSSRPSRTCVHFEVERLESRFAMDGFGLSREAAMPVPVSADTGVMAIGESSAM